MADPSRRRWLAWAARGVYGACAAAVAWPIGRLLSSPLTAPPVGPVTDRAVRLADLVPGEPTLVSITGERVDAWTRHPDRVVGKAWVIRTSPADVPAAEADVRVFSSTCPHAGCQVSGVVPAAPTRETPEPGDAPGDAAGGLLCPCHGAVFGLDGRRRGTPAGGVNPSPRGLDPLDHRLVEDDDGTWWVEIEHRAFRVGTPDREPV